MSTEERLIEASLSKLSPETRQSNQSAVDKFLAWTKKHGDFTSLDEIIKFQEGAAGRDRYRLGDLIQTHIREIGGTAKSMKWRLGILHSFFKRLHVELPGQQFVFTPTKDASQSLLTENVLKTLLDDADLQDRAIYLCLYQSMMDQFRFFSILNPLGFEIAQHLKEKEPTVPFKIDCRRGRKRNLRPFHTYLGFDSLTAIKQYFDHKRGWPTRSGEPIFLGQRKVPLTERAFYVSHLRRLEKLGYLKEKNDSTFAYGYGAHNLRDLAKTVLHLKGKQDGVDMAWVDFALGHVTDKLGYDQFYRDQEYTLNQFRLGEKYLNIVSQHETVDVEKIVDDRIADRDTKIEQLEGHVAELEIFVRHLAERPPVPPKEKKQKDSYLSWDPEKVKVKGKKP